MFLFRLRPAMLVGLALATAGVTDLRAQQIVPYGAVEASGFGNGVALIGLGIGTGRAGWGPVANVSALAVRIRDAAGDGFRTETALSAAIGVRYASMTAATSILGGYTFVEEGVSGSQVGGRGATATVQHDYWGTGERMAQLIGTYNFGAEYLWSRAKATQKLSPISPLSAGGELIVQGGGSGSNDSWVAQFGPVLQFFATERLRFDLSGGVALRNRDQPASGYARLEFVLIPAR
ncbi:MAG: hypothetical protein H0X64_12205 [Gemmatimonadaceae bacterium]|nr:hypothetical protein [Gemmatimonadaceae bacterium]